MSPIAFFRPGPDSTTRAQALGLLAELEGRWHGSGFNLMFLPDFDKNPPSTGPQFFRTLMNATDELLEVLPIGGAVPNRGSEVTGNPSEGQDDINIYGLRYLQQVSDANTHEALHIEPGFWLNVPGSTIPQQGQTIVRQGSIPHGTSILLQGTAFMSPTGKPVFEELDITALVQAVPPAQLPGLGYLDPFLTTAPPPPFTAQPAVKNNPNIVLQEALAPHLPDVQKTTVLQVSSTPVGGIVNIPFLQNSVNNNAATTLVSATFWVEHVVPQLGLPFDILQYSQTVILNFLGINWPHISVGTLFRQ
jgi:hypothetical protein